MNKIATITAAAIAIACIGASTSRADSLAGYVGTMDTQLLGSGKIYGGIFEFEPIPFTAIQLRAGYASSFDKLELGTINLDGLPESSRQITQSMLTELDRAGQFELEDFCVIPLEIGLVGRMSFLGFVGFYAGGGVGYYVIPAFDVVSNGGFSASENIADISGWWGLVGVEAGLPNLCFFAEAKYTHIVKQDLDIEVEYGGYTGTLTADIDLSGMTYLMGVRLKW